MFLNFHSAKLVKNPGVEVEKGNCGEQFAGNNTKTPFS